MIYNTNRFGKRSYLTLLLALSCSSFTAVPSGWAEEASTVSSALELKLTPASEDAVEEVRVARRPKLVDILIKSPEELNRLAKTPEASSVEAVDKARGFERRPKPADPPSLPPRMQQVLPQLPPSQAAPIGSSRTTANAINDGWVARDAIGSKQPLSDPRPIQLAQPVARERQAVRPEEQALPEQKANTKINPPRRESSEQLELFEPVVSVPARPTQAERMRDVAVGEEPQVTPETEESLSDEPSVEESPVAIRRLRIDRDGTPRSLNGNRSPSPSLQRIEDGLAEDAIEIRSLSRADREVSVESKEVRAVPRKKVTKPSESAARSVPRQSVGDQFRVGDQFEEVIIEPNGPQSASPRADAKPAPVIRLDYTGRPAEAIRLTPTVQRMQGSIQNCLQYYYKQTEVANGRSNWGMMHAMMVWGIDTKIIANRRDYSAIAWIAGNNACRGQKLLGLNPQGGIEVKSGIGLQGHQAQFLTVCALAKVPIDYPLYVGRTRFSVLDVVKAEMADCESGDELTFNLIGLAHYLDTDQTWIGADRREWDFERLIREELSQPIVGQTCGGTHRLMAYDHALRKRRIEGKPITGQWSRAAAFTDDFVKYAYTLQNRDGSMSTNWFAGRQDNGDLDRKIQTTGHIIEWLLTHTPDSELQDPRLVNGVRFLLSAMWNERDHDWEIGPKGHALRSLAMFYERVYKVGPAWQTPAMASRQAGSRR
ncbi:hypothetical protein Q31b_24440 [Novipirellula aureliae]|uniref:Uncharacterized protein n=1 Tax=Novipirellula aureliae TaxID=2527966 RepID=A0A5C6E3Z0_9BACT|nr:hypothetical protein [Novipirellula aureliae]TWU43405.1 hypothetical protein Q31b_24440 [Novipirellula aureliae]